MFFLSNGGTIWSCTSTCHSLKRIFVYFSLVGLELCCTPHLLHLVKVWHIILTYIYIWSKFTNVQYVCEYFCCSQWNASLDCHHQHRNCVHFLHNFGNFQLDPCLRVSGFASNLERLLNTRITACYVRTGNNKSVVFSCNIWYIKI